MSENESKKSTKGLTIGEVMAIAHKGSYVSTEELLTLVGEIVRLKVKLAYISGISEATLQINRAPCPLDIPTTQPEITALQIESYQRRVAHAARQLFDNRLGWSVDRNPYAPRALWADLGEALYGMNDPRVVELREGQRPSLVFDPQCPPPDETPHVLRSRNGMLFWNHETCVWTDRATATVYIGERLRDVRVALAFSTFPHDSWWGASLVPLVPIAPAQPPSARDAQPESPPPDALPVGDDESATGCCA